MCFNFLASSLSSLADIRSVPCKFFKYHLLLYCFSLKHPKRYFNVPFNINELGAQEGVSIWEWWSSYWFRLLSDSSVIYPDISFLLQSTEMLVRCHSAGQHALIYCVSVNPAKIIEEMDHCEENCWMMVRYYSY